MNTQLSDSRDTVTALTQELISAALPDGRDGNGIALLSQRLSLMGFKTEVVKAGGRDHLLSWRKGSTETFLGYSGHVDVVPAGEGIWSTTDPFTAEIRDGELYGRGAVDMKGSVAAWVVALEELDSAKELHSSQILLIAADEETSGVGTPAILARAEELGLKISSCLVGEPTSKKLLGDNVKTGRRGLVNCKVVFQGIQGHVAYPHLANNPIHAALNVFSRLIKLDFDRGLTDGKDDWDPTSFQVVKTESGLGNVRNIIPATAEIIFDVRFRPPHTSDSIKKLVEREFNAADCQFELNWSNGCSAYQSQPGVLFGVVNQVIEEQLSICPNVSNDGGTSDGRFIAPKGIEVVEFGLINATIHQVDERVALEDLIALAKIYKEVIRKIGELG